MKKILTLLIVSLLGSTIIAQTDISGTWTFGYKNTIVNISEKDGIYSGEIASSDNPKAKIGKQILKDFKQKKSGWTGKLYSARRNKWFDVVIKNVDDTLEIVVSAGFRKKTIVWKKA